MNFGGLIKITKLNNQNLPDVRQKWCYCEVCRQQYHGKRNIRGNIMERSKLTMITPEQYTAGQIIKETLEYKRHLAISAQDIIDEVTITIMFEQIGKRIMEWIGLFGSYYEETEQELEDSVRFLK